ncbi:MAG: ABC transporter permease [Anaerolineales bacterium]|nr:ABC transporter permease [Anaerolineales bacterium]
MTQTVSFAKRRIHIPWLWIYAIGVIIFLFFPIGIIILFSFNSSPAVSFPISGLSLRWYREVLASPVFLSALQSSLKVSIATTIVCVSLGTLAALGLTRYQFRYKNIVQSLYGLPLVLPGLFIGISLLSYFISVGMQLSMLTVVIGHLVYTLPYFVLVAAARLERFDRVLEDAAQDLGCTPWQTFWKVNFPIIAPSIIGAAVIVFALSFDEFLITFFVIGSESTLPMLVWSMMRRSIDPRVNAISVVLMATSIALIYLLSKMIDLREIQL